MLLTVVTALGTVMIPRIGYHFGRGENRQVRSYMYRGYRFVWFLGIPLYFGLLGTATNFVPWFFGGGFEKVVSLLGILGFLIIAIGETYLGAGPVFRPLHSWFLFRVIPDKAVHRTRPVEQPEGQQAIRSQAGEEKQEQPLGQGFQQRQQGRVEAVVDHHRQDAPE